MERDGFSFVAKIQRGIRKLDLRLIKAGQIEVLSLEKVGGS